MCCHVLAPGVKNRSSQELFDFSGEGEWRGRVKVGGNENHQAPQPCTMLCECPLPGQHIGSDSGSPWLEFLVDTCWGVKGRGHAHPCIVMLLSVLTQLPLVFPILPCDFQMRLSEILKDRYGSHKTSLDNPSWWRLNPCRLQPSDQIKAQHLFLYDPCAKDSSYVLNVRGNKNQKNIL